MVIFTDSQLLKEGLYSTLDSCIKKYKPKTIYLREKHLSDEEYFNLAKTIIPLCDSNNVKLYICHRVDIAKKLAVKNLHIDLKNLSKIGTICDFDNLSVSIHSIEEVEKAESLGATSLVYGHIFQTSCKPNLMPRGLESLKEICSSSKLPVIAIGGINRVNFESVLQAGSSDFAIMSSAMTLTF